MSELKLYAKGWNDYELIDAGGGKKLERWGKIVTIRPERQAYFASGMPFKEWDKLAHWEFMEKNGSSGQWKALKKDVPKEWTISFKGLTFQLSITKFKHVGLFPEQNINWNKIKDLSQPHTKLLNLFAYTGAASIVGKFQGADVYHVDAVKQLITWARKNQELSEVENIRWVHEDALKFAKREVKRGNKHDIVIMDPPAWGVGANKEQWKIENKLEELLITGKELLENNGDLIVNTYSPKIETYFLQHLAEKHFAENTFSVHELWMKTTTLKDLYFGNILYAKKE
jgi:23S rRNA (cytosine1962-C5)-methyltransferase